MCKTSDHGECGEEKMCSIIELVQSAPLLGALMYKVRKRGKQNLQVSLFNLTWSSKIVGVKTWQFAKLNFILQKIILHVRGATHHFPTSRVLAFGQVYILMPTTI